MSYFNCVNQVSWFRRLIKLKKAPHGHVIETGHVKPWPRARTEIKYLASCKWHGNAVFFLQDLL